MTTASRPSRSSQWLVPDDPTAALARDGFGLGEWRVEPGQRRIVSRHATRQLDPRVMDLLVFLAARPGQLVGRDQILDAVWHDAVVSENSLTQAVSRLRRALGDDRHAPRYVETVSRSGYRLVAVVEWPGKPTPVAVEPATEAPTTTTSPGRDELADARPGRARRKALVWIPALATVAGVAWYLPRPSPEQLTAPPTDLPPIVRPALTHVGKQFEPVLSPDGQHVAFAWQGPGEGAYDSTSDFDLWVQRLDGSAPVRLTDDPREERLPSWSADGLSLIHARFSVAEQTCGIYRVALIGGPPSQLADCPLELGGIDAAPDGRSLAVSAAERLGAPRGIFWIDLESGVRRRVTRAPERSLGDRRPAVSPDGRWIAFERRHNAYRHDVMVVAVDGTGARALNSDAWGQLRGVDWSSDGSSVLFSSNRVGRFLLWRSSLEDGALQRLPIEDDWVTQPSVATTGDRLIYRTFRDVVDLYALPLAEPGVAAGEPWRILSSTRSERDPVWSPDGESIAFLSDRSGTLELWATRNEQDDQLLRRTDLAGPRPESAAWSPDGRSLVFDAAVHGHADLWLLVPDSQRPRRLTDHPGNERNPFFSRDDASIYFASDRAGSWDIYRMPAVGGPARRVTRSGAFLAHETDDGDGLLVVRPGHPGIWRQPLDDGEPERLIEDLDLSDWGSWTPGRSGIYYLRRQPTTIVFHSFEAATSRIVYQPPKQMPYLARNLSLSPDGRTLLFALIDRSDDEVMVVDLAGL